MATITTKDHKLVVTLSEAEKIEAVRGGFEVPLDAIHKVEIVEKPIKEVHGLNPTHAKLYGMYLPGETAVGIFLAGAVRERPAFVAVHRHNKQGVRITLDRDAKYSELLISCDDPEEVVKLLS